MTSDSKKDAFLDKLRCLVTNHDSDSTSHSDIRSTLSEMTNAIANKATVGQLEQAVSMLDSRLGNKVNKSDVGTVEVVVTYTDETTETIRLLKDNSS